MQRGLLLPIVVASFLAQLLLVLPPFVARTVIDQVIPEQDYGLLGLAGFAFLLCQAAIAGTIYVRSRLIGHFRSTFEAALGNALMARLVDLPIAFFKARSTGDMLTAVSSGAALRELVVGVLLSVVVDGVAACLYLSGLGLTHPGLACAVLGLGGVRALLLFMTRPRLKRLTKELIDYQARSQATLVETVSGMETLKSMGLEIAAAEQWSRLLSESLTTSVKKADVDAGASSCLLIVGSLTSLLTTVGGAYVVMQGQLTLGEMIAIAALAGGLTASVSGLVSAGLQLQAMEPYVDRVNDILLAEPERPRIDQPPFHRLGGCVALRGVHFRYGGSEKEALIDIDLVAPAGGTIGIVGRTGSGKSTLARVIAGLYAPTQGTVMFDESDLHCLDIRSVRRQIGVVTQDVHLFGRSIRDNIAMGDPTVSMEAVIEACESACIHCDIVALKRGYETVLSDQGLSLSGGQRQRLSIARAIVRKPAILILDEATSHLDSDTEGKVLANLARMQCTIIAVTHRLAAVGSLDVVFVVENGRIVETVPRGQVEDAGNSPHR